MQIAQNVTVDTRGILIDGRRLPYWLGPDDIEIVVQQPDDGGLAEVRITLLAETASVSPLLEMVSDGTVVLVSEPNYNPEEV